MKLGVHQTDLAAATTFTRDLEETESSGLLSHAAFSLVPATLSCGRRMVNFVKESAQDDQIVIMSNGGFDNINQAVGARWPPTH